jgi:DNA-binding NtrC family response regulator
MPPSTSPFASREKPLSVVVADDVAEIRQLVHLWLKEVGCNVVQAAGGNELIRAMRAQPFELVITDIIMPDGDGLEVIREAKRIQPGVRLLAISGGGRHLQAVDCLRLAQALGAHAVLLKPFTRDELLSAVGRVLETKNRDQPHTAGAAGG